MAHTLAFYFCEKYRGLKQYLLAHSSKGLKSGNIMAGFSAPLGVSQGRNQGVYQTGLLSGGSGKEYSSNFFKLLVELSALPL